MYCDRLLLTAAAQNLFKICTILMEMLLSNPEKGPQTKLHEEQPCGQRGQLEQLTLTLAVHFSHVRVVK